MTARTDGAQPSSPPARRHVAARKPRFEASRRQRDELARRLLAAVRSIVNPDKLRHLGPLAGG